MNSGATWPAWEIPGKPKKDQLKVFNSDANLENLKGKSRGQNTGSIKKGIRVIIWRSTTTKESKLCLGSNLMPGARRNQNGITWPNILDTTIHLHQGQALKQKIKLFTVDMIVALG
jgi:hypothetical protein